MSSVVCDIIGSDPLNLTLPRALLGWMSQGERAADGIFKINIK